MSSEVVKPIKYILVVILIAIFWEFFIGYQSSFNFDFSDKNNQKNNSISIDDNSQVFKVKRVIDGDTFVIDYNNDELKVRMIGINTPESVDPRRPIECMGKEASEFLKDNIENKNVYIKNDNTQGKYDKYNRMLAYVLTPEGEDINKKILINGYGYEYTYDNNNPYIKQQEYKQAENFAKFSKKGLWSDKGCNVKI